MTNKIFIFLVLSVLNFGLMADGPNPVFCWLIDLQGCPGVEAKSGQAISLGNNGSHGVGAIGAKSERVETRTIINVPEYRMRRIKNFFGFGGSSFINSSYSNSEDCPYENIKPNFNNALMDDTSFKSCLYALDADVADYPTGIGLRVTRCQEYFCKESFQERFTEFLADHPRHGIQDINRFLQCENSSVEI